MRSSSRINLKKLQQEVGQWSTLNFGPGRHEDKFLGVVEEVGELSHTLLKYRQGIRGMDDPIKYSASVKDAVGDILIYLLDFCDKFGISLEECLSETWEKVVSKRNWVQHKETGNADG